MSDIEQRIAAAKARLAEAESKRSARLADKAALAEVEDLERQAKLADAVAEMESKHGDLGKKLAIVHATYADGAVAGSVIVKVASGPEWAAYKAKIQAAKGVEIDDTTERLWRTNVVYPDLAAVDALCKELPFLSTALGDAVGRLCGVRIEDLAAKQ